MKIKVKAKIPLLDAPDDLKTLPLAEVEKNWDRRLRLGDILQADARRIVVAHRFGRFPVFSFFLPKQNNKNVIMEPNKTSKAPRLQPGQVAKIAGLVDYQNGSVVVR